MAITKDKKQAQLTEITNQLREAKSVVFAQYSGITVRDLTSLRRSLRGVGATLKVIKKTLVKLAAKELFSIDIDGKNLQGQVAVICSNNELTDGPKIIKQFAKKVKTLKLVGGILDGRALSFNQVKDLADMPSREELVAKLLGSFMAPIQGFYSANKAVLSGFARVLDGHRKNLEQKA